MANPEPNPNPVAGGDQAAILAALMQVSGQASGQNAAVVPLWVTRPDTDTRRRKNQTEIDDLRGITRVQVDQTPKSVDYAESYWIDMPDKERAEFARRAQAAGLWSPRDGADKLVRAWGTMVDAAARYNGARQDAPGSWLSPFEAIDKLFGATAAGMGGTVNGFTGWRTSTNRTHKTFGEGEIAQGAKTILQQELGRDPTASEIKAYTLAANRESAKHQQTVVTKTRDTAFDADGRPTNTETQNEVQGEAFDPSGTIEGMVEGSAEHQQYQAAAVYLPALMQALGSPV